MRTNIYLVCPHCGSKLLHLGKRVGVGERKVKFVSSWNRIELGKMLAEKLDEFDREILVVDETGKALLVPEFLHEISMIEEWEVITDAGSRYRGERAGL